MDTPSFQRYGPLSRWLCRDDAERQRWVDMGERVRLSRLVIGASLCTASLLSAAWYGWWMASLIAAAAVILASLEVPAFRGRPEVDAAAIVSLDVLIAVGIALSGGAHSPSLAFITVPVVMIAIRFRMGLVAWGVGMCLVLAAGAVTVAQVLPEPPQAPPIVYAVSFVALLISLEAAALSLLSAEMQSRVQAVVDPLTGLFNRTSLAGRFAEVAAQARVLGGPVGVAMLDLDHFKKINDTYGHDRGDVVLRDVAYSLRKSLRTFDLVYRMGGEEFAVLLPGLDMDGVRQVCERLIVDVAGSRAAGLSVTMSAGITSGRGDELELAGLLKAADLALYEAKRAGRDRVCSASPPGPSDDDRHVAMASADRPALPRARPTSE